MIVALDLETTGVEKDKDKIIEIALVKFDETTFEIVETFSTLINPGIPIPEVISNITNIFDDDVGEAPFFTDELKKQVTNFIGESPILGHNTGFDREFLLKNGVFIEKNTVLDTFLLANIILPYEKSLNLGSLCESLGVCLIDAHRALDDTIGTVRLFEQITYKFRLLAPQKKELLKFLFEKNSQPSFQFYSNFFLPDTNKISEDFFIQATLSVVKKYSEPKTPETSHAKHLDFQDLETIFSSLPHAELRQNQLSMSYSVENSLHQDKKMVIEAPTGVGKTFAYLIPSLIYALKSDEQVVISTNTKALQDQIFYKDLTFLQQNLPYKFEYSKLKGRKNYFSISRYFEYLFNNPKLDTDETAFFSKICLWLFDTEFAELDELNYYPKEFILQKNINADHFVVLSENNDYKSYEPLFKARSLAQKSDIVIINHSLLIQEVSSSQPILGQMRNLIVDEAHNLEDTTTDALRKSFTINSFTESTQKILHILNKSNFFIDNLDKKMEALGAHMSLCFDLFFDYALKQNTFGNESYEALLEKDFFDQNKEILNLCNTIQIQFTEIFNHLQTSPDKIFSLLKTEIANLEEILLILKVACDENSLKDFIPIFSYNKQGNNSLCFTVLNPGKFLKKALWDKIDSIVLTSATLKISESFDYINQTLFLEDFEMTFLESDFDYSRQALLFIPNDLGSIKYHNPRIHNFLLRFLEIVKGKTLVLLTSFNAIKELYLSLNIPLKKIGTTLLAQGVAGSKHKVANHFKHYSSSSVILGTDSFWEGVDIPGDDLKYLFIHKFPFLVPTDPIFKARSKLYKDAFREYSVPKAIIKTKQGFGRLIRTKNDTGIVVLLDDRYYSTNWGGVMRASFPHTINIKTGSSESFLELIKSKF